MAFGLHKINVGSFLKSFSAFRLFLSIDSPVAGKNMASILVEPALLLLIQRCYPSNVLASTSPICLFSPKSDLKQHPQEVRL